MFLIAQYWIVSANFDQYHMDFGGFCMAANRVRKLHFDAFSSLRKIQYTVCDALDGLEANRFKLIPFNLSPN